MQEDQANVNMCYGVDISLIKKTPDHKEGNFRRELSTV